MAYKIQVGNATYGGAQTYSNSVTVSDKVVSGSTIAATTNLTINADGSADAIQLADDSIISAYRFDISETGGSSPAIKVLNNSNRTSLQLAKTSVAGTSIDLNGDDGVSLLRLRKADGSLPISVTDGALSVGSHITLAGGLTVAGDLIIGSNASIVFNDAASTSTISGSFSVSDKIVDIADGAGSNGTGARINFGKLASSNSGATLKYDHANSGAGSAPTWEALDGAAGGTMALSASAWIGDGSQLTSTGATTSLTNLYTESAGGSPITSDQALVAGGIYFVDLGSGNVILTLPQSSAQMEGRLIRVKVVAHAGSNYLRIARQGTDTLDGTLTSFDIANADASIDLIQGKVSGGAAIYHIM